MLIDEFPNTPANLAAIRTAIGEYKAQKEDHKWAEPEKVHVADHLLGPEGSALYFIEGQLLVLQSLDELHSIPNGCNAICVVITDFEIEGVFEVEDNIHETS